MEGRRRVKRVRVNCKEGYNKKTKLHVWKGWINGKLKRGKV